MTSRNAPRQREWKIGCKVYIGNLVDGASKPELEEAFSRYGPLKNVWVARNPPGFAFVEFEDGRDAEDACQNLDGTSIAGGRIKAEMSHGRSRRGRPQGPPGFRGPPTYPTGGRGGPYYGGGGSGAGPRGSGGGGHYNGGDYAYGGGHRGGPPPHMDRAARDRGHPPRPRSPPRIKEFRHYTRSRSNSLGKSPPPATRTARPRTPPSTTASPERH